MKRRGVVAPEGLREELRWMLLSMVQYRLTVELIPSLDPDCAMRGGKIRVVTVRNPGWYRQMCAAHPRTSRLRKNFRPDTKVHRKRTMEALERLAAGKPSQSRYAPEILAWASELQEAVDEGAAMEILEAV